MTFRVTPPNQSLEATAAALGVSTFVRVHQLWLQSAFRFGGCASALLR